jgi:hypothetical protein
MHQLVRFFSGASSALDPTRIQCGLSRVRGRRGLQYADCAASALSERGPRRKHAKRTRRGA